MKNISLEQSIKSELLSSPDVCIRNTEGKAINYCKLTFDELNVLTDLDRVRRCESHKVFKNKTLVSSGIILTLRRKKKDY